MAERAFDSHAFVKRLIVAGMPEPQAEVLAEEQSRLIESDLPTKRDLREFEHRQTAIILKWCIGFMTVYFALLLAAIKL